MGPGVLVFNGVSDVELLVGLVRPKGKRFARRNDVMASSVGVTGNDCPLDSLSFGSIVSGNSTLISDVIGARGSVELNC